jgi:hypothetical protein
MNFLELQFSLRGKTLPADHGYALYSAIKNFSKKSLIHPLKLATFHLIYCFAAYLEFPIERE